MWDVDFKPRLIYGSEVWACSSSSDEKSLEQIQERAGKVVLGVSGPFPGTCGCLRGVGMGKAKE